MRSLTGLMRALPLLWLATVSGSASAAGTPVVQGFDIAVPAPPSPVKVGARRLLVYELHLTNFASQPLTLTGLTIADASSGNPLFHLDAKQLESAMGSVGARPEDIRRVGSGSRAVIYLEVPIRRRSVPVALRHSIAHVSGDTSSVLQARTAVEPLPAPVLSAPLRGGPWTAVYDPMLERGHRRVLYAVSGSARIPGRFAVDWMPAGPRAGGKGASGLGTEVLAVADGVVVATRDHFPEPTAGQPRPRVKLGDATGNYIALNIGGGRFAFYEHLMPGLLVRPGQRVRRGQVIGRLGSTGQASRPHLHFHLADADSPLDAEGQPYLLRGIRTLGAYRSIAAFEAGEAWRVARPGGDDPTFPEPNSIVMFDER